MQCLETKMIQCPYCWEQFTTTVDRSECELSEEAQQYTEDCFICCHPIVFTIHVDAANKLRLEVKAELDG